MIPKPLSRTLGIVGLLLSLTAPRAQTNPYESDIRAFELADSRNPPAPNSILFLGSSTITRWSDVADAFPRYSVLNRGFGGSQTSDVLFFFDRLVPPYRPPLIVFYEGDNDLAGGKSVDDVFADWTNFVGKVETTLPNAHILYVSVKPSPSRANILDQMRELNTRVLAHTVLDPRLHFADVFTPMLNASGQPRPELFVSDNLHLNATGYALWQSVLGPAIDEWAAAYPVAIAKPEADTLLIDLGAADSPSGSETPGVLQWNNVTTTVGSSDSGVLANLKAVDGTVSSIALRMVSRFNGANENGTVASTLFPPSASRDSLFGNTETFSGLANVTPVFRLTGLNPAGTYRLTFYASRLAVSDNRQTRYQVVGANSQSIDLNPANNVDDTAVLSALQPDSEGVLMISLIPGPANNNGNHFTYLGALRIDPINPAGPGYLLDFGSTSSTTSTQTGSPGLSWNNLLPEVAATDSESLTGLVTTNGSRTSIALQMVSRFNGANLNGTGSATIFPQTATGDSLYGNTESFNGLSDVRPRFQFQNLNQSGRYDITFYASRTGVSDNRETRYTVTGSSTAFADFDPANNVDSVATISDVQPNESGSIDVWLEPGPNNNNANHFTYLGVLQLSWRIGSTNRLVRLSQPERSNARLSFDLAGAPGLTYDLQGSTNLVSWSSLTWVPMTNELQRVEIEAPGSRLFLRALQ